MKQGDLHARTVPDIRRGSYWASFLLPVQPEKHPIDVNTVTGQVLVGNIFLTNALVSLYRNFSGTVIITSDAGWTNINDANYTGAAIATGNTVR